MKHKGKSKAVELSYVHKLLELQLAQIYAQAVEEGSFLLPDEAMLELISKWNTYFKNNPLTEEEARSYYRKDEGFMRKLHHAAVDLYYDTYSGKQEGAPQINEKYLEHILSLSERGLSYGQIAKEVGLPITPPAEYIKSKDKIRKQLEIAEQRLKKPS